NGPGVIVWPHQTNAGRTATLNLILKARALTLFKKSIGTLAHLEHFLHQHQRLFRRMSRWKRPKKATFLVIALTATISQSWIRLIRRDKHIKVRFIITQ